MTVSTILVIIFGVFCYFILPFIIWACFKKEKVQKILTICFFSLYLIVLFLGVFGKLGVNGKVITIDFDFSGAWCAKNIKFFSSISKFDLVINLVMLFPVGMFVYYLSRRKKWWIKILILLGIGLLTGLFIETCQFILPIPRSVQLTDALLNMVSVFVGGLIGWFYLWIIGKFIKKTLLDIENKTKL